MEDNTKKKKWINRNWIIFITVSVIAIAIPFIILIYRKYLCLADVKDTGALGDTFGGLTAPLLSFIGSWLVYLALKSQIRANKQIQEQLEAEKNEKIIENQKKQINEMFYQLQRNIEEYCYTTTEDIPICINNFGDKFYPGTYETKRISFKGIEAINSYLEKLKDANLHNEEYEILDLQGVLLEGIIRIVEKITKDVDNIKITDEEKKHYKEMLKNEINKIFHKVINLDIIPCSICNREHSMLPYKLTQRIEKLYKDLE